MNDILTIVVIIGAIIMALVGFGLGYASMAEKSKGGAIAVGFLGAIIGAIIGVVGVMLAVGVLVLWFMFKALSS